MFKSISVTAVLVTMSLAPSYANAASLQELNAQSGTFQVPALPYAFNALEPEIDAETMKLHHDKHHKAYVDKLNDALPGNKQDLRTILSQVSRHPPAVRDNAGGHWNHSFFWTILTPDIKNRVVSERLKKEIGKKFGSMENLKKEMITKGTNHFASGWVWLIRNPKKQLEVVATANQDNPLMNTVKERGIPILGIDLWEHAYYLKYKNARAEYLASVWNIVHWSQVDAYDQEATRERASKLAE